MKKLITSSSSNIKGRRFEASMMTHVLILLPHFYVYHTCTRALHMSSPVANRSIVDLGSTVQKNKDTPNAILVMHALSGDDTVTTTYNVGKELAPKPLKQPPQKSCPSLGTFKPILMKYAAQKYGCEKTACKRAICMFSLIDYILFCAYEAGSSCLKQLTKRSWRR